MVADDSQVYLFGGYNGTRHTNELFALETAAFSSYHEDLLQAMQQSRWANVQLHARNGSVWVDALILKHRCPPLYEEVPKTRGQPSEVQIGLVTEPVLRTFVEYLYADLHKGRALQQHKEGLLLLAVKYRVHRLVQLCLGSSALPESTLTVDMVGALQSSELSDFRVHVGPRTYSVHRVLLQTRCPYFASLFGSGMSECASSQVRLDVSGAAFEMILEWVYSDKFPPLFSEVSLELGSELLQTTNLLGMQSLFRMTELALQRKLTAETVVPLLETAWRLDAARLQSSCFNFLLKEFEQVCPRLKQLSKDAFAALVPRLPTKMQRVLRHLSSLSHDFSMVRLEQTGHVHSTKQLRGTRNIFKQPRPELALPPIERKKGTEWPASGRVLKSSRTLVTARSKLLRRPQVGLTVRGSTLTLFH